MSKCYIDNSGKESGRVLLLWTWDIWSIGGGAGCVWKFLGIDINPGQYNVLWLFFNIQRWLRKVFKSKQLED